VTGDPAYYGLFVGKKGANVAAAGKLLDLTVRIKRDVPEKEEGGKADG